MRWRFPLLALQLVTAAVSRDARAQDTASRIEVLAIALEAVRGENPGRVIVHLPPESRRSLGISRSEIVEAVRRVRYTATDDPKEITGPPVQTFLRLEHATFGLNEASVLVAVARRNPDGTYSGGRTDKAILTRTGGRWLVKVLPHFALQ